MNELPPFLKKRPDGLYEDTRLKHKPGTKVSISAGQYRGQEAVIDTRVGVTQEDNGKWDGEPGYNALLHQS